MSAISSPHIAAQSLSILCIALATAGCVYTLAAVWLVRRFAAQRPSGPSSTTPGVTILKPLHGAELALRANLASFCKQNYGGPVEIIAGVQDPNDRAIVDVDALIGEFPDIAIRLVIDRREHGSNRKISNLINMSRTMAHDIVVLADSDISVEPDYLQRLVALLEEPNIGAVTCLYSGAPVKGLWSQLSAMEIDQRFLPGVIVGLALGRARPCFGSTIALRRETLDDIGGFAAFANKLADDNALGTAVRRSGLAVAIPSFLVRHTCPEESLSHLVLHEIRWARTIASIDPWGFAGSCITHPLPLALLGALFAGSNGLTLGLIAVALACRALLQIQVSRAFGLAHARLWLAPVRDFVSFAIYAASLFPGNIEWRGARFEIAPGGNIRAEGE